MKENRIRIIFDGGFFDSIVPYEKAATITVFDSFRYMCGFFADELQIEEFEIIPGEDHKNRTATVFLDSKEMQMDYICREEKTNILHPPSGTIQKYYYYRFHDDFEEMVNGVFRKMENVLPNAYSDVIELFLQERLWQITVLSQTCMADGQVRKQVYERCQKALDRTERINSKEVHFLYTKMYLQYLTLVLRDETSGQDANYRLYPMRVLFEKSVTMFTKSKNGIFIKLSAMIMGEMKNLDYAEKLYLSYINIISNKRGREKEIGKTYYELGKLYDDFSKKSDYILSSIQKASEYYRLAHKSDPGNYRAAYKLIFVPSSGRLSYGSRIKLEQLYRELQNLEGSVKETLRVYLYEYKIVNYLLMYSLKKDKSIVNNQNYLYSLQQKHKKIEEIWNMLGLGDQEYPGAGEEIDRYLQAHIEEMADLILTLRRDGADSKEFQSKRYNYNIHGDRDKQKNQDKVLMGW